MLGVAALALAACQNTLDRQIGSELDPGFGNATMNNTLIQSGQRTYAMQLGRRFSEQVTDTITFAFNSAQINAASAQILVEQANFIKQFPEVRFRVYGHTDLVGSNAYNKALGLRRAQAVVSFFAGQGISRSRLEALASFGETRPVVQTSQAEMRNRRTVTEVSGFVKNHPSVLNGKYAEVIHREYLKLGERIHPPTSVIETQVSPAGG
jgi:outer membrane protein OmpA-like peptidoglycan-associated protein